MAKRTGDVPKKAKQPPVLVRFTSASGIVWTVWDTTFSNYKLHRRPHGDPTAEQRVFVDASGVKRAYKFKPSESRVLEPQALERQLGESGWVGTLTDTSNRTAR